MASKFLAGLGVLAVLTALLSLLILVNPAPFVAMADWESRTVLYASAVGALVWALVLFIAAPASRFPRVLRLLAGLALLEAIVYPFVPVDAWAGYVRWWTVDHLAFYRFGGSTLGFLLAGFLIYAALPGRQAV